MKEKVATTVFEDLHNDCKLNKRPYIWDYRKIIYDN